MKKRIAALIIAPILGAVLGYLLVYVLDNAWLRSKWQMIEQPPVDVLRLVAISQDSLWVQSASGTIYYNENSSTCEDDCWLEVTEVPALPIVEPSEATVTSEACGSPPPLSRATDKISECWRTYWVDTNFTFALRNDGSIYLWQANLYKEWSVVLLFGGVCIGALALFIPTIIIVLFLALRDWRLNRAKRETEEKKTSDTT